MEEKLPISERLKVIDSFTLFKSEKWWGAVVLVESFGKKQVNIYLWLFKDGKWKRKHKFVIRSKTEWTKMKEAVEKFIDRI